jgi:ribosome-associated protein
MLDDNIKLLAKTAFEAVREIKGQDIIGLDLAPVQSYADFIFVVSGNNIRQVQALADNVQKRVFEICKRHPLGLEGFENAQWILVDYGDVICHIFFEETRKAYKIEDMWPSVHPMPETKLAGLFSGAKVKPSAPKKAKPKAKPTNKQAKPSKPKKKSPKPAKKPLAKAKSPKTTKRAKPAKKKSR